LQARILDETTFETIKLFDTIPGAVNAAGGRTYPMEVSVFDDFLHPLISFSGHRGHAPAICALYRSCTLQWLHYLECRLNLERDRLKF
jgi:hypothetical protein